MNGSSIIATPPAGAGNPARRQSQAPIPLRKATQSESRLLFFFGLLISAWMFDFRAAPGSAVAVLPQIYLGLYVVAFGLFFVLDRDERTPVPGLTQFLAAVALFLLVGLSTGLFKGQQIGAMLSIATPSLIYMSIAYATARAVLTLNSLALRKMLALLCIGYVIGGVAIQRLIGGTLDFETVRYQILSGATLPALGYLECLLLFGLMLTEWGALIGGVTVVFLSVTRTFLIAGAVQASSLLPGATRLVSPRLLLLMLAAVIFVIGLSQYGAFGLDRWTDRLFNIKTSSGEDVTLYTRESEWNYMASAFAQGGRTILFGNGLAAETVFYMPREIGGGSSRSIGFGHNEHLSILFIGGLVGGGLLLFMQFLQALQSFRLLARLARLREQHSDTLFLAAWGAVIIIGVLTTTFFSSTLNNRGWSLWYGVGTGLFLGARARYLRDAGLTAVPAELAERTRKTADRGALPPAVAHRRSLLEATGDASQVGPARQPAASTPPRALPSRLPPAVQRRRALLAGEGPQST
ncbi:hypothetical protein [Novosphingobium percolationis]|uniref:hypothetical protein n=1 Tax=Novosphingobium percolationis TaxID=2871811 RepID=UPI001CD31749|nr:hypothetical protein [Novosphingobium percolationis]